MAGPRIYCNFTFINKNKFVKRVSIKHNSIFTFISVTFRILIFAFALILVPGLLDI